MSVNTFVERIVNTVLHITYIYTHTQTQTYILTYGYHPHWSHKRSCTSITIQKQIGVQTILWSLSVAI